MRELLFLFGQLNNSK